MDAYRRLLLTSLPSSVKTTYCPPEIDKLRSKAAENSFDGDRTANWLRDLEAKGTANFDGITCPTGHRIYVVSDRGSAALLPVLREALRILTWLSTVPITMYWWDNPWARSIPGKVDPGPEHVNGGWAIPGIPEVHVYRREEALKVMIHETIHARLLDVRADLVTPVLAQFEARLGRRLWPHLGECYTELFAGFLWSLVNGHSWSYQLQCSKKQAGQVWARIHDSRQDEKTNVFAYYILKWVLMQHEEVFFGRNHSVGRWFAWFEEALPALEALRRTYKDSEIEQLSLAMSCPTAQG